MIITHAVTFAALLAGAAPASTGSPAQAVLARQVRESMVPVRHVSNQAARRTAAERQEAREAREESRGRERLEDLYERGMDATHEGQYERALAAFARVAEAKGPRTDGALYWKAYAENRLGRRPDALATLAALMKEYPTSRYMKDAKALELEIRNAGGQPVSPARQEDDDLKVVAINAMLHSSPDEAVPLLEQVLQGTSSPRVKARALYVLALINSPQAHAILARVAKGGGPPDLQSRAIQYLGVHGGTESRAVLAEIYASTADVDIRRRILQAYMVAGEQDRILEVARNEQNADLRAAAVRQLGVMNADAELWQLYQKETDRDVKRQIIQAMFVGGRAQRLLEIARTEQDAGLRRTAVRNLGLMGADTTGDAILQIYGSEKDTDVRKAAVEALFLQGNSTALVSLARKEQDPDLKKTIIERLGLIGDKVSRDFMLEILKK